MMDGPCETHDHEREKRKREETSSSQAKKIRWRKDKGKRDREKIKDKKKRQKGKAKRKKKKGRGRVRDIGGSRKKKGTTLPFTISSESAIKTHRGKRQSWSTRRELRMGTRNYGFRRVPKGMSFSYTGYFLPSGRKGYFGSAHILGLFLLKVKD